MKKLTTLAALGLVTALTACGPDTGPGYYDSRGNYHADNSTQGIPKHEDNYYVDHAAVRGDSAKVAGYDRNLDPDRAGDETVVVYKHAGYYDSNGNFIPVSSAPSIPHAYFPPRGQCRVWFVDRAPDYQPPVESCVGIQERVPAGAYVVYGG